jgi:hypothetical protein
MKPALDPAAIARLRVMLGPRPDRYCFAAVMERWAAEVLGEPLADISPTPGADQFDWPPEPDGWADELVKQIVLNPKPERRGKPYKPRRPRADRERYAALLLAVIFNEFTGLRPWRTWRNHPKTASDTADDTDKNEPFYQFGAEAFRAIKLEPTWKAFREATERWPRSRGFNKQAMKQLLWGGLGPRQEQER